MDSPIEPEFREWAKAHVQHVENNLPEILQERLQQIREKNPISLRPDRFSGQFSGVIKEEDLEIWFYIKKRKQLLENAVAKIVHNEAAGQLWKEGLSVEEEEASWHLYDGYTKDKAYLYYHDGYSAMEKGYEEWKKRNWHLVTQAFEKYVKLQLEGYEHKEIREHLTPDERNALNHVRGYELHNLWPALRTKPQIQRLLNGQGSISDVYQTFTDEQLRQEAARASAEIFSATRTGGLMIFAPSGWGKSRLLGRSICYEYAKDRIGTVVLDVVGGTIDNALDTIAHHKPDSERQEIGSRIRYCNMAGERIGREVFVTGWPMLTKRSLHESFFTTSQRIVDLIATTDVNLSTASIQGLNRVAPLLTALGIVLSELGLPLSHTFALLEQSHEWHQYLPNVTTSDPEVQEAKRFLLAFLSLPEREQELRSEVLKNKLSFLRFDAVSRAMFSAPEPLIDWAKVAERGLQVYIDFRNETSAKALQMKLFWVWGSLMEFIRSRGSSGRHLPPLAVVIDELSYFVGGSQLNTEAISEEFREFVQVRRRNANILLTASTQERAELPPTMQSACLQLPSQLYGATSNPVTALENAQRLYEKNPMKRKHGVRVYIVQDRRRYEPDGRKTQRQDPVLLEGGEIRDEYMSLEEQDYENSLNFLNLAKAEWLFAKSPGEGIPAKGLQHLTTARLDHGRWVREEVVSQFRQVLMKEHGFPVSQQVPPDQFGQAVSSPSPKPPPSPVQPQHPQARTQNVEEAHIPPPDIGRRRRRSE